MLTRPARAARSTPAECPPPAPSRPHYGDPVPRTCVFFHAHPDDEALLTSGTMAMLAAEGHRVVLVVATLGEQGLASPSPGGPDRLGELRLAELMVSADALGCARVVCLGYRDSGPAHPNRGRVGAVDDRPVPFAEADTDQAAHRLAALLREEDATLLTTYDSSGGYGHPDHVQVHRVGAQAAMLAGTPLILQATYDRSRFARLALLLRLAAPLRRLLPAFDADALSRAYTAGHLITHRVDVRRQLDAKRRSLAAHATQATGGGSVRTLALLLRLPRPLFGRLLGTEYFVQQGGVAGSPLRHPLESRWTQDSSECHRPARPGGLA